MGSRSYPSPAFAPLALAIAVLHACGPSQPPPSGPKPPASAAEALKACEAIERLLDAGKDELALNAAESLAKSCPNDALPAEMLARSRMAARRPSGDIADAWARVAQLRPDSPGAQSAAGVTAATAERWTQALAFDERAEALEPGNPQHPMQRAIVLGALGRKSDAVTSARRAASLAPLDATAQLTLARSLVADSQREEGRAAGMQAVKLAPSDIQLRIAVAALLRESGAAEQAVLMMLPIGEPLDAPLDAIDCLARCQAAAGRHADAARTWMRVADGPLGSWQPCLAAAECLAAAGDLTAAREWISRARERGAPRPELQRAEENTAGGQSVQR